MKMSASVHRYTRVDGMMEGLGGLVAVAEAVVGMEVDVKVRVDRGLVEKLVLGDGVEVMVRRLPDTVVRKVVAGIVVAKVLSESPDVDTRVRVMGSVPVGVVTKIWVVSVPPAVVVKLVTGGVVTRVTGVPLTVSTMVVGLGVMVMTVGVPPTLVVTV
jgi:hypothetical protein